MKRESQKSRNGFTTTKRYLMRFMLPSIVGILVALHNSFAWADSDGVSSPGEVKAIAASVNGVPIEMAAVTKQVQGKIHSYQKYGAEQHGNALAKQVQLQVLDRLISVELIYQEAKKLNIEDLESRVEEALNEMSETKKATNLDETALREFVTKKIFVDEYLTQQKLKNPKVPETEILAFYNQNKESFRTGERVRTRHILVGVKRDEKNDDLIGGVPKELLEVVPEGVSKNKNENKSESEPAVKAGAKYEANATNKPLDKDEAYKKITKALNLLQDGSSFAEVAKEYSDCASAQNGGDLGYTEKGYMPESYDEVAFSIKANKLSGIIETKYGYHVLEVLDRKQAGFQSYEDVKEFIARYLNIRYRKEVMDKHLAGLKAKAKIDIYL